MFTQQLYVSIRDNEDRNEHYNVFTIVNPPWRESFSLILSATVTILFRSSLQRSEKSKYALGWQSYWDKDDEEMLSGCSRNVREVPLTGLLHHRNGNWRLKAGKPISPLHCPDTTPSRAHGALLTIRNPTRPIRALSRSLVQWRKKKRRKSSIFIQYVFWEQAMVFGHDNWAVG